MNVRQTKSLALGALGCAALLSMAGPSLAQDQAVDFSGQRIEVIVPFGEGGGADTFTRFVVPFLAKHLPGEPSIVVRNMPGGGGVVGMNWFEANAKTDGTHFATCAVGANQTYALSPDDPNLEFDPTAWHPFLASPLGRVVYVHADTGIETLEDLKTLGDQELLMASQSPSGSDMPSLLAIDMLGINFKPLFGTDGGDGHLAFERGEIQLNSDVTSAYQQVGKQLVDAGTAVPLFSFGIIDENGEVQRDPTFPDMPTFVEAYEVVHGQKPSGPAFDAWKALSQIVVMSSKVMVLPAGAPEAVVAAYDQAARDMLADPEFQASSAAFIGDYAQGAGEEARDTLVKATTLSDEARAYVIDWLKAKFDVTL